MVNGHVKNKKDEGYFVCCREIETNSTNDRLLGLEVEGKHLKEFRKFSVSTTGEISFALSIDLKLWLRIH